MGKSKALLARPRPPDDLTSIGGLAGFDKTVAAPDLLEWIKANYLDEEGALFTPLHAHLRRAHIGCLWATAEYKRRGRRVAGLAEMPVNLGRGGAWAKARSFQQLEEWFGVVPDFLLTFDVVWADQADDASFAALVDHELTHCAQAEDEFGEPRFNKATGEPVWAMRGHDVEEFVSVVRRFGIEAAGEEATNLVIAAAKRPEIAKAKIAQACGTCIKAVA